MLDSFFAHSFSPGPVYDELMGGLKAQAEKRRKSNLKQNTEVETFPLRDLGKDPRPVRKAVER